LNPRWLPIARLIGIALVVLSVVYLGRSLWENGARLATLGAHEISVPWLIAGALLFAGNHLTNSAAWIIVLRQLGQRLSGLQLVGIALTAQVGKYAPGNIAHQIGRATLASQRGVPVKTVAWSALLEVAGIAVACGLIGSIVALTAPQSFARTPVLGGFTDRLPMLGALALAAVAAAVLLAPMIVARVLPSLPRIDRRAVLSVISCDTVGYALAGGSFYAVAAALGVHDIALAPTIGVYAAAWFIGFVTPGAPAGLGVREAILVALLSGSVDPGLAVTVAIAHRLLTAFVDGIAFLAGAAMLSRPAATAEG
jgi:uncharacterized membrane protein YbhN (UPF0104 family)